MRDLSQFREGLKIEFQEDEDAPEESIFQPLDYPDLPTRCRLCGSTKHLQQTYTRTTPWRMAVTGEMSTEEMVPVFASAPARPVVTPVTNQAN